MVRRVIGCRSFCVETALNTARVVINIVSDLIDWTTEEATSCAFQDPSAMLLGAGGRRRRQRRRRRPGGQACAAFRGESLNNECRQQIRAFVIITTSPQRLSVLLQVVGPSACFDRSASARPSARRLARPFAGTSVRPSEHVRPSVYPPDGRPSDDGARRTAAAKKNVINSSTAAVGRRCCGDLKGDGVTSGDRRRRCDGRWWRRQAEGSTRSTGGGGCRYKAVHHA